MRNDLSFFLHHWLMDTILQRLEYVFYYMDDILIASSTSQQQGAFMRRDYLKRL